MTVRKLHTAVCTCDGCGVTTELAVNYDSTLIECLPAGWYMLEVKVQYRTDCGYNPAPPVCLTVCSKVCAGKALGASLRHV